nr:DinB family protein [Cellulomonas sp. Root485]
MAAFTRSDDLQGATFVGVNLRGARFMESDLSGIVMRGVEVVDADIDAPWLPDADFFRVNGVDVIPFVEAELDRRFPGRSQRRAADPDGLRDAWAVLERTWAATLDRVAAMPDGTVDVSVDGEWSFAQTLRHLVLATDTWLGKAILRLDQPFHPLGQVDAGTTVARRSSARRPRRMPRSWRRGPVGSRWCVTSWRASLPTSSTNLARTRTPRSARRPSAPACT